MDGWCVVEREKEQVEGEREGGEEVVRLHDQYK